MSGRKEYRVESRRADEPWREHATVWEEKASAVREWTRLTAAAQGSRRWQLRVTERTVTDWEPIEHMGEAQEAIAVRERTGCCDTWPKPCDYHEGWQDALETISVFHAHPGIIHAHPGGALDHGPPSEPEPEVEQ